MRRGLKFNAFSYIEVLVAMVIISGVFTAFINMAYSAVHRAKILESKDLMENYAYSLLERFGDALAASSNTRAGENIWSTTGDFFIDKITLNGKTKEVLSRTNSNCSLTKNEKYLKAGCTSANDVLLNASNKFAYYFHLENVNPGKVIKVTVVLGCVQNGDQKTCNGEDLPPVKIVKFFTNYGQEK